jgi:AcrR family transcriptional regulator
MSIRPCPRIASRKQPKQARSTQLVRDILASAAHVVAKEGAHRFTTRRVAEKAGISVGSLYQYFPNKAAILFRLQTEEWEQTGELLRRILEDRSRTPLERLHEVVMAFVRSECEEAGMRMALRDAAPFYREAPEAREPRLAAAQTVEAFLREALPKATENLRCITGHLIMTTLDDVGRSLSKQPLSAAQRANHSRALSDMLCSYLERVCASSQNVVTDGSIGSTDSSSDRPVSPKTMPTG